MDGPGNGKGILEFLSLYVCAALNCLFYWLISGIMTMIFTK